jgi:hypothetical protein
VKHVEPELPPSAEPWHGPWPQSPDAFAKLVDAYLDRLLRYAFRKLRNLVAQEEQ